MTAQEFAKEFETRRRNPEKHYSEHFINVDGHEVQSAKVVGDSVIGTVEIFRNYNRTNYNVILLFGEWPDNMALGLAYGSVPYCGGHTVSNRSDGLKHIEVMGCD